MRPQRVELAGGLVPWGLRPHLRFGVTSRLGDVSVLECEATKCVIL